MPKSKVVVSKDKEGNEVKVLVKTPSLEQTNKAQECARRAFSEGLAAKAPPRALLDQYLEDNQFWTKEHDEKIKELGKEINTAERQLKRGGKKEDGSRYTKKEAKKLALKVRELRNEQLFLLFKKRSLDEYSLEGMANKARDEFFFRSCLYHPDESDDDGNLKPLFASQEEYEDSKDEPFIQEAISSLQQLMGDYDYKENEKKRVEIQFLIQHGFMNDDLQLIREDGKLVDEDGRLVNKDGRYVNENNELVDINGLKVDEDGNPVEEYVPFED